MDRRRLLLVAVAVVAGLLLVARCGQSGDGPATDPGAGPPSGDAVDRAGDPGADDPADPATGAPTADTTDATAPPVSVPPADPLAPVEPDSGSPGPTGTRPTGPAQLAAVAAAEEFARAWVRGDNGWSDRLAGLATAELAGTLADVDPATVPATAVTGPGSVLSEVPGWASVGVPTDTGTVVLHVVQAGDAWLVSAIDWRPRS